MKPLLHRSITALCAAVIGACALTGAAPAHAGGNPHPDLEASQSGEVEAAGQPRAIAHAVALVGSPRNGAPALAQLSEGMPVEAFCAFSNDGRDWIKIQHTGQFGFVPSGAVTGGAGSLPRECPNEVVTIHFPVFSHTFRTGELGVELEGRVCPTGQQYLANDDPYGSRFIPRGVIIENIDKGIHADFGPMIRTHGDRVSGFAGGSVSNWGFAQSSMIWMTCTSDINRAWK